MNSRVMNVSFEVVISAIGTIVAIATSWGISKGIVSTEISDMKKQIDILQGWKDHHIEEQAERIREIEREMAELRGMMAVGTEQYKEILRRLTIIEIKMEERRIYFSKEENK